MSAKAFPKRILIVIVFFFFFSCTSVILPPVPIINSINACLGDNVTMLFEVNATYTFDIRGCEDQEMLTDIGEGKPVIPSKSYEGRVNFISKDQNHIVLVLLNVSNTDACNYTATGLGTRSSRVELKICNGILQPDITIENTIVPYVYLIDMGVEILVQNKPVDLNGTYNCHENCDALTILTKTHRSMLANISIIVDEIAEVCKNESVCTYTLKPTTELTEVNIAVDFGIVPYNSHSGTFQVVVGLDKLPVGKEGSHNVKPIFYVPLVILVFIIIFASVILVWRSRMRHVCHIYGVRLAKALQNETSFSKQ